MLKSYRFLRTLKAYLSVPVFFQSGQISMLLSCSLLSWKSFNFISNVHVLV